MRSMWRRLRRRSSVRQLWVSYARILWRRCTRRRRATTRGLWHSYGMPRWCPKLSCQTVRRENNSRRPSGKEKRKQPPQPQRQQQRKQPRQQPQQQQQQQQQRRPPVQVKTNLPNYSDTRLRGDYGSSSSCPLQLLLSSPQLLSPAPPPPTSFSTPVCVCVNPSMRATCSYFLLGGSL